MDEQSCEMPGEFLSALIDDELRGHQRVWVAEHASGCDVCAVQLGRLVAAKEALKRDTPVLSDAPLGLFEQLRHELDRVDSVARAAGFDSGPRRHRHALSLALAGLALIAVALVIRHHVGALGIRAELLVQAHETAGDIIGHSDGYQTPYNAVSVGNACGPWQPLWQRLLTHEGAIVRQTVYVAGRLPISAFLLPTDSLETTGLQALPATPSGDGVWVGEYDGGSVVVVCDRPYSEVLVARTSPDHLLGLWRAHLLTTGISVGY